MPQELSKGQDVTKAEREEPASKMRMGGSTVPHFVAVELEGPTPIENLAEQPREHLSTHEIKGAVNLVEK